MYSNNTRLYNVALYTHNHCKQRHHHHCVGIIRTGVLRVSYQDIRPSEIVPCSSSFLRLGEVRGSVRVRNGTALANQATTVSAGHDA